MRKVGLFLVILSILFFVSGCGDFHVSSSGSSDGTSQSVEKKVEENLSKINDICIEVSDNFEVAGWKSLKSLNELIKSGKSAVPQLVEFVKDKSKNEYARVLVISEVLMQIKDKRIADVLMDIIEDRTESDNIRRNAIDSLGDQEDERAVNILLDVFCNRNESMLVRDRAGIALDKIGSPNAIDVLLSVMEDDTRDTEIRVRAAFALGSIKSEEGILPLIDMMKSGKLPIGPFTALCELARSLRDDRAIEAVVEEFRKHPSPTWAGLLGEIKDSRVVDALIEITQEGNTDVAREAIRSLGKIGDERAVPALESLLDKAKRKEETRYYKWIIATALEKITGKDYQSYKYSP